MLSTWQGDEAPILSICRRFGAMGDEASICRRINAMGDGAPVLASGLHDDDEDASVPSLDRV